MIKFINSWLVYYGLNETLSFYISNILAAIAILLISFIVNLTIKKFLLKTIRVYIMKTSNKWDDVFLRNNIFKKLANIVPAAIIHSFAPVFPKYQNTIQKIAFIYISIILLLVLRKFLNAINDIYVNYEVSKTRPIKGYLQVIEIVGYIIGAIIIVSVLIERSPLILLSGIGAATAVLVLIFQNSILGLVASIQLTSNDMLKIGDWIEMPQYGADGDVLEISLHTVKIQNFDKTIANIPTYKFLENSFKNWRGMQETGGRRIKRSIYIDMNSIKFCSEEMIERFKNIRYIDEYIESKIKEIYRYNKEHNVDSSDIINAKHITNIGIFRIYIQNYLKKHPKVHKDMIQIVRQLQPTENGLPIEIYIFTNDIVWQNYESIQSDIFDHVLAIAPEFNIQIYQNPSGNDLKNIVNTK